MPDIARCARIRFPVGQLTVFVGANGVGKTNLYRALQLLQAAAAGTLAREIASEGGMESALWAGKRKVNKPVRIKLSVGLGADTDRAGQSSFDYDDRGRRRIFLRDRGRVCRCPARQRWASSRKSRKRHSSIIAPRGRLRSSNARVRARPRSTTRAASTRSALTCSPRKPRSAHCAIPGASATSNLCAGRCWTGASITISAAIRIHRCASHALR